MCGRLLKMKHSKISLWRLPCWIYVKRVHSVWENVAVFVLNCYQMSRQVHTPCSYITCNKIENKFICDSSRTCNYEYYCLLGCDTMLSGRNLSTFQGNLLSGSFKSSGMLHCVVGLVVLECSTLETKTQRFFETSRITFQSHGVTYQNSPIMSNAAARISNLAKNSLLCQGTRRWIRKSYFKF
jgi:hypothetical protein